MLDTGYAFNLSDYQFGYLSKSDHDLDNGQYGLTHYLAWSLTITEIYCMDQVLQLKTWKI